MTSAKVEKNHLASLDGLRGVAILLVLICHTWGFMKAIAYEPGFFNYAIFLNMGKCGVELFFILSGYLLYGSVKASFESQKLSHYFCKRVARIYPSYALAVIFYAWHNPENHAWAHVLSHLTFTHTFFDLTRNSISGVFWSMGPETQFYLILPLLVLLILQIDSIKNFSKKTYAWLGLFIFGTVCRLSMIALWGNYQTPMFDSNFLNYIEFFFLGIFLSDARFEPNAWMRRRLTGSASQLTDLTLLALFAALSYWIWACEMGPLKSEPVPTLLNPPLLALIYGALILSARFGHGFISMTANWKPLSYLGKISFGVFLFHLMIQNSHLYNKIQNFLRVDTMPREFTFLINFLILLALSVVVAAILHKYYESPIIDWTHRRLKDRSSAVRKTKLDKTYDSV